MLRSISSIIKHAGALLLLAAVIGCTGGPPVASIADTIGDGGFLSHDPCGPPCFWNIIPGVSSEDEVVQILRAKDLSQECQPYNHEAESAGRGISCASSIGVSFRKGTKTVEDLGFVPSQKITLEAVIAKLGAPDRVFVVPSGLPEHPRTVMLLYYDNLKTIVNLAEQDGITFVVQPSLAIKTIGYSDRDSYEASRRFAQYDWKGYVEYRRQEP